MKLLKYALLLLTIGITANECSPIEEELRSYTRSSTILLMTDLDQSTIRSIIDHRNDIFVLWNPSIDTSEFELPQNLIILSKKCSHNELKTLTECEHFDFAVISNHLLPLSNTYIEIIAKAADYTFFQTPESERIKTLLTKYGFNETVEIENTSYSVAKHMKSYLPRTTWFQPPSVDNSCREILSTPERKVLKKRYGQRPTISKWVPGINLLTFKMLEGIYPTKNTLITAVNRLFRVDHNDWMPNNMVVQGRRIALIDFVDPHGDTIRTVKSEALLNLVIHLVSASDSVQIPYFQDLILEYNRNILHPELDF